MCSSPGLWSPIREDGARGYTGPHWSDSQMQSKSKLKTAQRLLFFPGQQRSNSFSAILWTFSSSLLNKGHDEAAASSVLMEPAEVLNHSHHADDSKYLEIQESMDGWMNRWIAGWMDGWHIRNPLVENGKTGNNTRIESSLASMSDNQLLLWCCCCDCVLC